MPCFSNQGCLLTFISFFFNRKLGLPIESSSSSNLPKDCVPASSQVIRACKALTFRCRHIHLLMVNLFPQKRQGEFDFIDPLAPKKPRISHLTNRGSAASSSSERHEEEGSPSSKPPLLPPSASSGPPSHLPISSHTLAPSHQQPSPASNSNSPSTPEGCGTQDLPTDQSSSYREPSPSPFSASDALPDRYQNVVSRPASPSPPPCTSLTVTSTVVTSPPLSNNSSKFKKKSKKHKDKDREKERKKRTERGSVSPPVVAEPVEESCRAKKKRSSVEVESEVHKDQGLSSCISL